MLAMKKSCSNDDDEKDLTSPFVSHAQACIALEKPSEADNIGESRHSTTNKLMLLF